MDSRFWLTLIGLAFCASSVFSYPLVEEAAKNETSSKNETEAERGAERSGAGLISDPAQKFMQDTSNQHEFVFTCVHTREKPPLGGCKVEESEKAEDDAPLGPCECEAYRSIAEKMMLRILPEMESSAVDPGIMLGCSLNKEKKVQLRLAIRFKSKLCTTNCHKICGADGGECKATKEYPLRGFKEKFNAVVQAKSIKWQITEVGPLDAGEFMNAIGGCSACAAAPASCPPACGCPQTYTAQECPAGAPPQCCNAAPAAGSSDVQMQQIVVPPAPQQPMTQASQPVPAPAPCQGSSCMMGIPVVQANICAPHCSPSCAPSCSPSCCNGEAGKRMLGRR